MTTSLVTRRRVAVGPVSIWEAPSRMSSSWASWTRWEQLLANFCFWFIWLPTIIWLTDCFWSWSCIERNIYNFVLVIWIRIRADPHYERPESLGKNFLKCVNKCRNLEIQNWKCILYLNQGCGSTFNFCGAESSCFLNADSDPVIINCKNNIKDISKVRNNECGSGSTALI